MIIKITCSQCGAQLEYDNKSVWEGNRDFEEICCPLCGKEIDRIFTDLTPCVRVIKEGIVKGKKEHN